MRDAETSVVVKALSADGDNARFVGGAVRNALLGLPVDDIDIATPLLPDDVVRRLEAARIRAIPTGIDHGTITAVIDGRSFEITTLRRDVETDGRRAIIAFSDSWKEDASRRDFTINALYSFAGRRVVRLFRRCRRPESTARPVHRRSGCPHPRRLFAYPSPVPLPCMVRAGADGRTCDLSRHGGALGLRRLSGERVQKEMLRLLAATDPCAALHVMEQAEILQEIIPGIVRLQCLERLIAIDSVKADAMLRLAVLLPRDPAVAAVVAERLRLSNENRDRFIDLSGAQEAIAPGMPVTELRKLLYRLGAQRVRDRIFLRWSEDTDISHDLSWNELLNVADNWRIPEFPLSGRDVLAAGIPAGPRVGAILSQIEMDWIEGDFGDDCVFASQATGRDFAYPEPLSANCVFTSRRKSVPLRPTSYAAPHRVR